MKDRNNTKVTESSRQNETLVVLNPIPWWPKGSIKANGVYAYLYILDISMACSYTKNVYFDSYSMNVGLRNVNWSRSPSDTPSFTINGEPFYCKGVNKHEDFAVILYTSIFFLQRFSLKYLHRLLVEVSILQLF